MWMVGIESRMRKGSLKTYTLKWLCGEQWEEDKEKAGKEVEGNQKCFRFLKPGKRVSGGREAGEVSTESSAVAAWCSSVILANVMELRREGSRRKGRGEGSDIGEGSLGRREERKVAGRGLG